MALSDMAIKKAKPREKIYTLKDADGLYLEIKPSGKKYGSSGFSVGNPCQELAG